MLGSLRGLLVAHGLSHQVQWSVTLPGAEGRRRIDAAMAQLRKEPLSRLGASPVVLEAIFEAQCKAQTVNCKNGIR